MNCVQKKWIVLVAVLLPFFGYSQKVSTEPTIFDYGKMWTFEHAPKDYFQKTYNFNADEAWLTASRKAALRFATWCSASFVSPNGLIMTNHHCSNGEMPKVMKEGEDFNANGFYANTLEEERKVEGLFVEQLLMVADITSDVKSQIDAGADQKAALKAVEEKYAAMDNWKGLRLQSITYYSGGKYSLYGYKRYDDIRLVFIPELQLGFYGGDPDNFTYPRYNLDCTFWRAYEDGKPANTGANFFKFNADGIKDGEPVFVVGNPGSTERYRTVSQLEYDRDYRYNILLESLQLRHDELKKQYDQTPSPELLDQIFGLSNSIKAISGILKGLHDPVLFGRKQKMEQMTRKGYNGEDHWAALEKYYADLKPYGAEINLLSPSPLNTAVVILGHQLNTYSDMAKSGASDEELATQKEAVMAALQAAQADGEQAKFVNHLNRLQKYASKDDMYLKELMGSKSPAEYAANLFSKSKLMNAEKVAKALSPKKIKKSKDGFVKMGRAFAAQYNKAATEFRASSPARKKLEEQVANAVFQVHGDNLPPDATFTLRISDGVVKGYNYNGTDAPVTTTYFGLYDRHHSNKHLGASSPWELPAKWKNPPMDLLSKPMNFVSTNDIIGGNSGSAIINSKREAVGLIFDGNIESLPGNFIYEPTLNRAVSVHAGGITAALEYIYKADRLVNELLSKKK